MGLQDLQQALDQQRILPVLSHLLPSDNHCFLVGGAIRDALQDLSSCDYDFAMPGDPTDLARSLAKALDGAWFMLDEHRRQSRVVVGKGTDRFSCDFAPFRAADLDGDLYLRDFTINAMAMPVQRSGQLGALYDPLGGENDLDGGRLRCCSDKVFLEDPLRVLKGLRHCLYLHLEIEPATLERMRQAAPLLARVAPERIRSELAALFAFTPARRGLQWLHELGLLDHLFDFAKGAEVFSSGLELLDRSESWLAFLFRTGDSGAIIDFFGQELEQDISNEVAFKLAAWMSGVGIEAPGLVLEKLRCSRNLRRAVDCLLSLDKRQAAQLKNLPVLSRSRALWAEDLGSHPELAVLFLGLLSNVSFAEAANSLLPVLHDLQQCRIQGRVPGLVTGSWLQKELKLKGQDVGRYLADLRKEEIAGRVLNSRQAEQFLLQLRREGGQKND